MDVRLPDGTIISNVPDGTTKAQLVEKLKANGYDVSKLGGEPPSAGERLMRGLRDPIDGGAQLLTKALPESVVSAGNRFNNWLARNTGLVGELPAGGVDEQVRTSEQDYQTRRAIGGDSGFDSLRLVGNIASPANIAIGASIPRSATLAGRVLAGASGGAASAALSPVSQDGDYAGNKLEQIAMGGAFGAAVPAVTGAAARIVRPEASRNPNLQLLREAGVRPTVGQATGGVINKLEEKATSLPIMGDAISAARSRALEDFNNAVINRATAKVGAKVQGTGQAAVKEAGDLIGQAYDDALNQIKFIRFDGKFAADVRQLKAMAQSLTPPMRSKFNTMLDDIVGGRTSGNGSMLGPTFKKVDSELGQAAARYGRSTVASETELGDALKQLQALLREQAMRTNPKAAEAVRRADSAWADLVRIEGAAKAGKNAEGLFTPAQLNMAVQQADSSARGRAVARGTARMQDLSNAGQAVLGNKVPNSFTTDRALIAGGGLGAGLVNPLIPLGLLGGAAAYSSPMQGLLGGLVSSRGQLADPIADAIRKASPALIPGAAQLGIQFSE